MTIKPNDFLGGFLPLGESTRLGALLARPIFILTNRSDEGAALVTSFLKASRRARWAPSVDNLKVFDQAAQRLELFASNTLNGDELRAIKGEIE